MANVTVIIPYFNDSGRISRCINSVLNQTKPVSEIIIIDDCSDDSHLIDEEIINNKIVTYVRNRENKNGAYCRNFGVEKASGEYIALLDADDFWDIDHINKSLKGLVLNDSDFVYSNVLVENKKGDFSKRKVISHETFEGNYCDILLISAPQTNSFFGKRIFFEGVRFDQSLRRHQDYQFFLDALKSRFKVSYLDIYSSYHCASQRNLQTRYNFESALGFWSQYETVVDKRLYTNYLWLSAYLALKSNGDLDMVLDKLHDYLGINMSSNLFGKTYIFLYFNLKYRILRILGDRK